MGLDGDDDFQGINPSMLARLMKSLNRGATAAQPVAGSYTGQFSRLGLDTGPVSKLLADYAWATGQQTMLNRRYSLASHQPSGDFLDGWTEEGAGSLLYPSTAAAKKAGTADAKLMLTYLEDHDWKGIQRQLDALAQNTGDPDYNAAFFSQLGPTGLYGLSLYAQGGPSSDKDNEQEVRAIVGSGLASASYEMNLTNDFLQGIEPEHPPVGYVPAEMPGGWDTGALAPFLTEGEFSSQWLQTMSGAVLYQRAIEEPGGPMVPPGYDAIFTAMSSNPGFAAQFFKTNAGQLTDYMTDPELYHYLASGPGFGQFLTAATIPPAGAADTKPFTTNATAFIQLFSSGEDTSSTVRQAMAAVTVNYFGDLAGTVTAAAPVADPDGPSAGSALGLNQQQWSAFVEDAMKDKSSAALLLTFYANWSNQQPVDSVPQDGAGDGPDTPQHAGYWHDASSGLLDYFMAANYQAAGATAGNGSGSVKDTLLEALGAGGATLLTSVVFGPEAGGLELLADAGKDAFSSATESTLNEITAKLTEGGDAAGPGGLDASLTNVQRQWATAVQDNWRDSRSVPGHSNFPAVQYNGVTYTGDPLPYERQYGGSFMNSDGSVKSLDDIGKNPGALAAYNAWLQDPAVSNQVGPGFAVRSGGSVLGYYDNQMSGG